MKRNKMCRLNCEFCPGVFVRYSMEYCNIHRIGKCLYMSLSWWWLIHSTMINKKMQWGCILLDQKRTWHTVQQHPHYKYSIMHFPFCTLLHSFKTWKSLHSKYIINTSKHIPVLHKLWQSHKFHSILLHNFVPHYIHKI